MLRRGLDVIYNARLPVLGTVAPTVSVNLQLGVPKTNGTAAPTGRDFYDAHGVSLVTGKAALVPAGEDPSDAAAAAAAAGARAVLVYGPAVPAGPLDLPTVVGVPVVGIPAGPALQLLAAFRLGVDVGVSLGAVHTAANPQGGLVAVFSSRGLSYDGRVKPNLVAPGVGLTTANAGTNAAGEPAFATVNGTSAAAASVAGAAALLLQARPTLDATSLKSLLVGYARLIPGASLAEQGGGTVDVGLSAAGEVVASPSSLPFGRWTGGAWRRQQQLTVRNISTRPLTIDLRSDAFDPGATVTVAPATVSLRPGVQTTVTVTASAAARATANLVAGEVVVAPRGSQPLHIAWAITFGALKPLLTKIVLHERSFAPSDAKPALLDLQIGQIVATGSVEIRPVDRLDIVLYDGAGKRLGLLARERALLPGTYRFALTGRGPDGRTLAPGAYALRLTAWRTVPAPVSTAVVRFRIT
ncbi:MAG: S8 family serine peptidase [Actinobacteria bacterium]|nr:S8 family serine peptidase [Actinomycetota bacterium]